jgi:hypothetical protein
MYFRNQLAQMFPRSSQAVTGASSRAAPPQHQGFPARA